MVKLLKTAVLCLLPIGALYFAFWCGYAIFSQPDKWWHIPTMFVVSMGVFLSVLIFAFSVADIWERP